MLKFIDLIFIYCEKFIVTFIKVNWMNRSGPEIFQISISNDAQTLLHASEELSDNDNFISASVLEVLPHGEVLPLAVT